VTQASPTGLVVSVTDSAPPEWDEFLQACPNSQFFHTPLWTKITCRYFSGSHPIWLFARWQGMIRGGMVAVRRRRGLFLHLASHLEGTTGGPLLSPELSTSEKQEVFTELMEHYTGLGGGIRGILTTTLPSDLDQRFRPLLEDRGWHRREVVAAVMSLTGGIDHVEMHVLKKNRRNERNRSLKRGCQPGVTNDPEILAEYYPIYHAAALRWGVKIIPLGLLRDLFVEGAGQVFLAFVRYQGRVIGGHFNFHWGDRVTAWNGATLPEHNDKFPATLLIWTDLVEACRRGATWLDLGGSGGITKLANFKKLLGAEERIRGHYERAGWPYRWVSRSRRLFRQQDWRP
jgi:CelD/BcsL family acetyltransferase involved in cellulose biosynthesis